MMPTNAIILAKITPPHPLTKFDLVVKLSLQKYLKKRKRQTAKGTIATMKNMPTHQTN